jgi:hypothetical protein
MSERNALGHSGVVVPGPTMDKADYAFNATVARRRGGAIHQALNASELARGSISGAPPYVRRPLLDVRRDRLGALVRALCTLSCSVNVDGRCD